MWILRVDSRFVADHVRYATQNTGAKVCKLSLMSASFLTDTVIAYWLLLALAVLCAAATRLSSLVL